MEPGILSVDAQGAVLHRTGQRIVVTGRDGSVITEVPLFRLRGIWLFGSVEATSRLLRACLREGPPLHYLTMTGRWRGTIGPGPSPRAKDRLRQYRLAAREKTRLDVARMIVGAKLQAEVETVKRWNRNRRGSLTDTLALLKTALDKLDAARSVDEVMGVEGTAAKAYFAGFGRLFTHDHCFSGRNRRPPKDPVNALLSFGYTLLMTEMQAAVCLAGLDPYLGFLHATKNRRMSLVLDLMEPFRCVVDDLVLTRMNLLSFKQTDFTAGEGGAVLMKPGILPRFVKIFGERLGAPLDLADRNTPSVRTCLRRAAVMTKEAVAGRRPWAEALPADLGTRPLPGLERRVSPKSDEPDRNGAPATSD